MNMCQTSLNKYGDFFFNVCVCVGGGGWEILGVTLELY